MYCSVDEVKKEVTEKTLQELTDDIEPASSIDNTIVTNYIQNNDVLIDNYLKNVATLPITDTSDLRLIKTISIDLTVCDLFERRLQTELVKSRRERAMNLLKEISKGLVKINSSQPGKGSVPFIRTGKSEPIFDKRFKLI